MRLSKIKSGLANSMALVLFVSVTIGISGCGQNLGQALSQGASSSGSGPSGAGGTAGKVDPWAQVDLQGVASNPIIGGTFTVFHIDTVNNTITLSVPLPVNPFGTGGGSVSYPIPQIPGATVSVGGIGSAQQTLDITVPLRYLVKGLNFDNPTVLPNGNPLPGIPGGELPRIGADFQNSKFQIYVYGSVKYFAVFVPIHGFNPYVNLTFPINNSAGTKTLGYISTVVPQGTYDGGMFMSLVFPAELQAVLDNLFS